MKPAAAIVVAMLLCVLIARASGNMGSRKI